jgi:hypothetical protein
MANECFLEKHPPAGGRLFSSFLNLVSSMIFILPEIQQGAVHHAVHHADARFSYSLWLYFRIKQQ